MKTLALTLALATAGAVAYAQGDPEDHQAHHPGQGAPAMAAPAQTPPANVQDGFERQMAQMRDMHERMMSARTPRERAALMNEQMDLMQSGMSMMEHMGGPAGGGMGMGMGGAPAPNTPQAGQQPGAPAGMGSMMGMMGMMDMHAQMERRMAMMQMMMQMMVDREAATTR